MKWTFKIAVHTFIKGDTEHPLCCGRRVCPLDGQEATAKGVRFHRCRYIPSGQFRRRFEVNISIFFLFGVNISTIFIRRRKNAEKRFRR